MKRTLLYFYLAALLLNAPSLRETASNLPFDHPLRPPLLTLLTPLSTLTQKTHLSTLRLTLQTFERQTLE